MSRKIDVIIKDPGKKPRHVAISNTLENLQRTVGGYIETVTIATDCVVICDEEGRLKGYEHNCHICGVDFVGTIIIAGINGDELADIPVGYQAFKLVFPELWK